MLSQLGKQLLNKAYTNEGKQHKSYFLLQILNISNPRSSRLGIRASHYYVRITNEDESFSCYTRPYQVNSNGVVVVDEIVHIPYDQQDLYVKVYLSHRRLDDRLVGQTHVSIKDFLDNLSKTWSLAMFDEKGDCATDRSGKCPTIVEVHPVSNEEAPVTAQITDVRRGRSKNFMYRVMILTRGTRGDVQPFVALARGLAEMLNWEVIIVTELGFKEFVQKYSNVKRGRIRFRPSGGDTMKRVDSKVAKWAMKQKSDALQLLMLARSEGEFFDSEPLAYHWAEKLTPDLLIFGFTMTNLAQIISESLRIPIMGFILQPTCIPSKQYAPVTPIKGKLLYTQLAKIYSGHELFLTLKTVMENNPIYPELNKLRKRRGLEPIRFFRGIGVNGLKSDTWIETLSQDVPLIVPMHEYAFGGKPPEWSRSCILTDFIFLRSGGVPPIPDNQQRFLDKAKKDGAKIVVMSFSSMPVERSFIIDVVIKLVTECVTKPRIMCLRGIHGPENDGKSDKEKQMKSLVDQQLIVDDAGSPFGRLFPLVDCSIVHGGLGTTAESLRAGIPTIVTGVLLMDQRFWGQRMFQLGVGPAPVHIKNFDKTCVKVIDTALSENSEWATNAKKVAKVVEPKDAAHNDGVAQNVNAIKQLSKNARIFTLKNPVIPIQNQEQLVKT